MRADRVTKIDEKAVEDIYSLTPMQEGMLFHYLKTPAGSLYVDQLCLELSGEIKTDIFQSAWKTVQSTNETLRTVFRWEGVKEPVQIVLNQPDLELKILQLSVTDSIQLEEDLEEIKKNDRQRGFDLREVPFRVTLVCRAKRRCTMIVTNHHIIYDGWSTGIILNEFLGTYQRLLSREEVSVPKKSKYKEFVKWVRVRRSWEERQSAFWKEYLYGYDDAVRTDFAIKQRHTDNDEELTDSVIHMAYLSKEFRKKAEDFAGERKITLATLLYTSWGVLLQKYNNSGDVVFGATMSGRPSNIEGIEEMVGLFINTVPLRVKSGETELVAQLLQWVQDNRHRANEYEAAALSKITGWSEVEAGSSLFDTIVVIENYPLSVSAVCEQDCGLAVDSYTMTETTNYDLTVIIRLFDEIEVQFVYPDGVIERDAVLRLADHFNNLLQAIITNPMEETARLRILSEEEERQLLEELNSTDGDFPSHRTTLHRLFNDQAEKWPRETALFTGTQQMSYGELMEKSLRLAAALSRKGVIPGAVVGLMLERSVEMVIGIFGILYAGAAYLPMDPDYPPERINYMLKDSSTPLLLKANDIGEMVNEKMEGKEERQENREINLPESNPSNLAYIIYTSGSTGKPKGVMVEHRAAINLLMGMHRLYPLLDADTFLLKTSFTFDVSIHEMFGWYLGGGRLALMEPGEEKEPTRIIEAVESYQVTHISFVPSMFSIFLDALNPANIGKLSCLKNIFLGGEALLPELVDKFRNLNNTIGLENVFGPTEAAVYSSTFSLAEWDGNGLGSIPIGKPMPNTSYHILDRNNQVQPVGIPGELCIGGPELSRGYLNRPELTAERFTSIPYRSHGSYRTYKTGDLCRWLPDGNLQFLGRMDFQIKIRGFRVELGEIENQLLTHDDVKAAVLVAGEDQRGDRYLCAYVIPVGEFDADRLKKHLARVLPKYMVPSYIVPMETFPWTSSGKINRNVLPEPQLQVESGYVAPRNPIEEQLAAIWSKVLDIEVGNIGIDTTFIELGGNSIKAMRLNSAIGKTFNAEIGLKHIVTAETIPQLAELITAKGSPSIKTEYFPAVPDPANMHQPFPLTEVQMAYLLGRSDRIEMGGISTHIYREFKGKIDIQRFNTAFDKVIARHPMMRAIITDDGSQQIMENISSYPIEVEDISQLEPDGREERLQAERERMSHAIFKTDRWPLFEIKAFKCPDREYHLCIGIDILIADAFSMMIIARELGQYYENQELELPPLELTFRDYITAYKKLKGSEVIQRDKEYWLNQLESFPPAPSLPLKADPAEIRKPHFNIKKSILDRETWKQLKKTARLHKITPSALVCTAYAEVLAYWSNQQALAINLTVFNRFPVHPDVDRIVGDFTSIILLGIHLQESSSFWAKARSVQERLFEGLEHRHYDGVDFIRELARKQNMVNKAIMPIVFTSALFDNTEESHSQLNIHDHREFESVTQTSQVYLDNAVSEVDGRLIVIWSYVENLFEQPVIDAMFAQYTGILTALANSSDRKPGAVLPARLPEADQKLLEAYNQTEEELPLLPLHCLFANQAEATPDNAAVVLGEQSVTYRELDTHSNRLACYLRDRGTIRNMLIGVMTPRSPQTMVNVLAILKAGGAYVPIEPEYPEDRRNYIITNSNCYLTLDEQSNHLPGLSQFPVGPVNSDTRLDDLAYVIYTSGSTGRPKGVVITHGEAANTIVDINHKFDIHHRDRTLGLSSMCFDLSVYDVFGTLSAGAALVLIPDQRDIPNIIETVVKQNITIWNSVPAIMELTVNEMPDHPIVAPSLPDPTPIYSKDIDKDADDTVNEQDIYRWSPAAAWRPGPRNPPNESIRIGAKTYRGIAPELFPRLYFLAQDGVSIQELEKSFPGTNREELNSFARQLVHDRVLVNSILTPDEVFKPQGSLLKKIYDEEILINPEAYNVFKKKQLSRTYHFNNDGSGTGAIALEESTHIPDSISRRRTIRKFDESRPIPFGQFSEVLSIFRQTIGEDADTTYYYYASAGGLYPVDIFVYVKQGRVENLTLGLYYYSPRSNTLHPVASGITIGESAHYPGNRDIFSSSAFTVFMIYNAEVSMPKYGGMGYYMAGIDSGLMVGVMTQISEILGLGVCSIGNMYFHKIKHHFRLNKNQVFLHAVEAGLKPEPGKVGVQPIQEPEPALQPTGLNHLRLVMMSGDWIPLNLPEKIKAQFPNANTISLGGATEGSIWSIYYPIETINGRWNSIPYGYPLSNQRIYVLNFEMESCPVDVPGEIYIGGNGVAEGYLNDFEKTRDAYLDHPRLGRIYRTGDHGVFRRDGFIEFLGRKDQQVKIRGYRIELGEIETCLMEHEGIGSAVVIDRKDETDIKYLAAYITGEKDLTTSHLRSFLSGKLPDYMVPSYFVKMEKIPLTANGKVDRTALPEPRIQAQIRIRPIKSGGSVPATDMEKTIVRIFNKTLKHESLGIHDNFFDLGANSLDILQLSKTLKQELGRNVPLVTMYEHPTVSSLAAHLNQGEIGINQIKRTDRSQSVDKAKDRRRQRISRRATGR